VDNELVKELRALWAGLSDRNRRKVLALARALAGEPEPAGDDSAGMGEPVSVRLEKALGFVKAQGRFKVHVWYRNERGRKDTAQALGLSVGGVRAVRGGDLPSTIGTWTEVTIPLADVYDVEVGE